MPDQHEPPRGTGSGKESGPEVTDQRFCRWNSLNGYCLFGGTPTILDPRQTGNADVSLTNIHEQAHRDLVNNTVYGYVLRRLRELSESRHQPPTDARRLMISLSSRVWSCAEGSATAMEFLTVKRQKSKVEKEAFLSALPKDYREALSLFEPLTSVYLRMADAIVLLAHSCLIAAVAEVCADWAVFQVPLLPESFWELAGHLNSGAAPDEILPDLARSAARFPVGVFGHLFNAHKGLLAEGDFGGFARKVVAGLKAKILTGHRAAKALPRLLEDDARLELFRSWDAQLNAEFPGVVKGSWRSGQLFGQEVQIEPQEPPFLLADENIEPRRLVARMTELSATPDFEMFVVQFFPTDPKTHKYDVIAQPIKLADERFDLAEPYLISKGVDRDTLRSVDTSELPLVWLTTAIALVPSGFYDAEFFTSLSSPGFLELESFSWEKAASVANGLSGEREVAIYDTPQGLGLSIAAIHVPPRTVFGLTPPRFLPDFELKLEAQEKSLLDNPELAVVFMCRMRQSRKEMI